MSGYLKRIGVATLLLGTVVLAFASPVSAIESQGIGELPANPRADNPRTKSIFVYELKGDETTQDAVSIINNTNEAKTIEVYATDSVVSSDGAFACEQAVEPKNNVGAWITFDQKEVQVASFDTVKVPFTVALPANADVGEHNGCVVIQDLNRKASTGSGIALSFRSALRVAITVPGKLHAELTLKSIKQQVNAKTIVVSPSYTNTGNVSVDATINARFVSVLGKTYGKSAGGQFPILPKVESRFNFEVSRPFWGGLYKRELTTDYKPLSIEATKSIGDHKLHTDSGWVVLAPKPVAAFIEFVVLALLVGGALLLVYRRREHAMLVAASSDYKIRKGDDIQSIAAKNNIGWRRLAKINHLKAPYTLSAGQVIKVPTKPSKAKEDSAA